MGPPKVPERSWVNLVVSPIGGDRERFLVPGRLAERLGRGVQQVPAGIAGKVERRDMSDTEHVPSAVLAADDAGIVLRIVRLSIQQLADIICLAHPAS